jgi:hypothetical protein
MRRQIPHIQRLRRSRGQVGSAALCGGVLALLALQGCQRVDTATAWAPVSPQAGAYLEDGVLASRVKAALLLSPVQNSAYIGVDVRQGVVLLSGRVDDATQRDLAVFVAQSVRGVHKVSSFIFVPGVAYAAMDYGRHDEGVEAAQASPDDFPALSSPLAADDAGGRPYSPTVSPMRALAYRVLGIGSIQDELLIKP